MIRGVLFDMDGVLLDTERLGRQILPEAVREMGHTFPDGLYNKLMGVNRETSYGIYHEAFGADFNVDALLNRFFGRLMTIARTGKLPFKPGFQQCIDGLAARAIPCALATGTERAVVETYQAHNPALDGIFAAMICGTEISHGKPAPDIYKLAAERLGLTPEECVGVEDSRNGVCSLRAAGCHSVMIPDLLPFTDELAPYVDTVLRDLTELCPLIDRLNGIV